MKTLYSICPFVRPSVRWQQWLNSSSDFHGIWWDLFARYCGVSTRFVKLTQWLSYSCKSLLIEFQSSLFMLLTAVVGTQQRNPHMMPLSNIQISKNRFSEKPYFARWFKCNFFRTLYNFRQIPINYTIEDPGEIKSCKCERCENSLSASHTLHPSMHTFLFIICASVNRLG